MLRWKELYPVGALLAVEDDTTIETWNTPLSKSNPTVSRKDKVQLSLKRGDLLIFHALKVHAGSYYPETNIRFHCYGVTNNGIAPIDSVFFVEEVE